MKNRVSSLLGHSGFIRYFKNTSWLMAEHALRIVAGLLVGIWVARFLGPEKFGLFSYVLAFTAIFGSLAKLGLDGILVRELVNHPDKRDRYLGTAFWLKVIGAILAIGLIAIITPFTTNDPVTNIFILIIATGLVFQSFEVIEFHFQSLVLAKVISICKGIQLALSSIIKVSLVLMGADLVWFVLVTAFDVFSLAIAYSIAYKVRKGVGFYRCFDKCIAKKMLRDSWPLVLNAIAVMVYMRIDQIMIKQMLGDHEVGIYSAALKLSEAFYFIPIIITSSLFPAILNAKKLGVEVYHQRMQRLYIFMVWIPIIIAFTMLFFSDRLILILFGNAYQGAGAVLMIHMWAAVFGFLGKSFVKYLVAENLTKVVFKRALLGAFSNVLLNLWLIPTHGLSGAAIATVLTLFIVNIGYDVFDRQLHGQLKMKITAILWPFLFLKRFIR